MARSTRGWTSEGPGPRSRRAGGANSPGIAVTAAHSTRAHPRSSRAAPARQLDSAGQDRVDGPPARAAKLLPLALGVWPMTSHPTRTPSKERATAAARSGRGGAPSLISTQISGRSCQDAEREVPVTMDQPEVLPVVGEQRGADAAGAADGQDVI